MNEVFQRGGVRIGQFLHASWPFCYIKVDKDLFELNASIIGKMVFRPGDIERIEIADGFFKGKGIRIVHNVKAYKSNILFQLQFNGDPYPLLEQIKSTGFLENRAPIPMEDELAASEHQSSGMFSMKPWFAITLVVMWNLLALININQLFQGKFTFSGFPYKMLYSTGFMAVAMLALLLLPPIQQLALKPGRSIKDLRSFFVFALLICTFIFCMQYFVEPKLVR